MSTELDSKQLIYQKLADYVKAKTGKNIGRSGGQDLFNLVIEQVFAAAVTEKTFRFNGGYGSLRVKNYGAGARQLPSGKKTTFGERSKLRYEQGVSTTSLINGNEVKSQVTMPTQPVEAPAKAPVTAPAAAAATPVTATAPAGKAAGAETVNLD